MSTKINITWLSEGGATHRIGDSILSKLIFFLILSENNFYLSPFSLLKIDYLCINIFNIDIFNVHIYGNNKLVSPLFASNVTRTSLYINYQILDI